MFASDRHIIKRRAEEQVPILYIIPNLATGQSDTAQQGRLEYEGKG